MKKTLLYSLVFFGVLSFSTKANAQDQVRVDEPKYLEAGTSDTPQDRALGKAEYVRWKRPIEAASSGGGSFQRYVSFLFPDSTVVWVPSTGDNYYYGWHSVGAVFDPNDINFELDDDGVSLSRFDRYQVDSIYMPYLYVRYVDSVDLGAGNVKVVDTLVFQFFTYKDLNFSSFNGGELYAKPIDFNSTLLRSTHSTYTVKIPLTDDDSTAIPNEQGWFTQGMFIDFPAIPVSADPNAKGENVCGFSVVFKTMLPYAEGDTMEARNGSTPNKRLNYFGHTLYLNEGDEVKQFEDYNNSFWVPKGIRYGGDVNGWTYSVPGNAYYTDRYIYYQIHINATVGIDELDGQVTIGVSPNPVSKFQTLAVDFHLVNPADVSIQIYDLAGHAVKEVTSGYHASGEHTYDVNVSDLAPGVYLYAVRAGSSTVTKKLIITD